MQKLHFRDIMQAAAVASVRETHMLHVCLHKLCKTPDTVSLQYQIREDAKESWGPAPIELGEGWPGGYWRNRRFSEPGEMSGTVSGGGSSVS